MCCFSPSAECEVLWEEEMMQRFSRGLCRKQDVMINNKKVILEAILAVSLRNDV